MSEQLISITFIVRVQISSLSLEESSNTKTKKKKRAYLSVSQPHVRVHFLTHPHVHTHRYTHAHTHTIITSQMRSHVLTYTVCMREKREPIIVLITPPTWMRSSVWMETCRSSALFLKHTHTHTNTHTDTHIFWQCVAKKHAALTVHLVAAPPCLQEFQQTHVRTHIHTHPSLLYAYSTQRLPLTACVIMWCVWCATHACGVCSSPTTLCTMLG